MGKCPHCGSKNIRRRYREHRRYKWRCRSCNRVFRRPKSGILLWLIGAVVLAVAATYFAAQQGIITLPSPLEESADNVAEIVIPTVTSVEPVVTVTTTLQSVSTKVADNAPQVQATVGASARSAVATVSVAIAVTSTTTPMSTLTPSAAFAPTVTPTPTLSVTPTIAPAPTVTFTPTPLAPPHLRHIDEKRYMLELINAERMQAGVPTIELGDNIAAQLHAESALKNCFSSHWGIDGLKPYMRYSLAGGYQSNGENGHGSDYCITGRDGYTAIENIEREINDAMEGWMGSPGHRRNILDEQHKKVSIGLAWDRYNFLAYQHFEGDYVGYDELPSISADGTLSLSGTTKNGVFFRSPRDLGIQISYDQPPHELTRGQISRTYCYDGGLQVASLREPLKGGSYWTEDEFPKSHDPCPNPYDVPADAPPARSHDEAHDLWQEAYDASKNQKEQTIIVPWITASEWIVSRNAFSVTVNIAEVLEEHGDGVYTIVVWGDIDGERAVISEYSIFHGITPPDTYTPF